MHKIEPLYSAEELAERAGVSRRTVRYYVQLGLLEPPLGLGRGKHYGELHLATLIRVRELQESGVPLDAIPARLHEEVAASQAAVPALEQSVWTRVPLSDDVELHLRGRRLTNRQLQALRRALERIIEGGST